MSLSPCSARLRHAVFRSLRCHLVDRRLAQIRKRLVRVESKTALDSCNHRWRILQVWLQDHRTGPSASAQRHRTVWVSVSSTLDAATLQRVSAHKPSSFARARGGDARLTPRGQLRFSGSSRCPARPACGRRRHHCPSGGGRRCSHVAPASFPSSRRRTG